MLKEKKKKRILKKVGIDIHNVFVEVKDKEEKKEEEIEKRKIKVAVLIFNKDIKENRKDRNVIEEKNTEDIVFSIEGFENS